MDLKRQTDAGRSTSAEASEIVTKMTEPVNKTLALEALIVELKQAGIWGRLGKINWARDSRNGLLLEWVSY